MRIDRHRAKLGQKLWAYVDGVPREVIFQGLAAYQGFYIGDTYRETEVSDDALFAPSREELVSARLTELFEQMIVLQRQIVDLLASVEAKPNAAPGEGSYRVLYRGDEYTVQVRESYLYESPRADLALLAHFESGPPRFPIPVKTLLEWGACFFPSLPETPKG